MLRRVSKMVQKIFSIGFVVVSFMGTSSSTLRNGIDRAID
jgi:hypothetical protein